MQPHAPPVGRMAQALYSAPLLVFSIGEGVVIYYRNPYIVYAYAYLRDMIDMMTITSAKYDWYVSIVITSSIPMTREYIYLWV